MKILKTLVLSSLLLVGPASAEAFGAYVGPFSLQFNAGEGFFGNSQESFLDDPVCYAISRQKRLEMIVEAAEMINKREMRTQTKILVVEPYAFGITRDRKPSLRGNVVDEKIIKEVTVKFFEDKFDEKTFKTDQRDRRYAYPGKGYFSGWFKSKEKENIDFREVSDIRVVEDSHFDIPKDYKGVKDDDFRVICQLPVNE